MPRHLFTELSIMKAVHKEELCIVQEYLKVAEPFFLMILDKHTNRERTHLYDSSKSLLFGIALLYFKGILSF